METVALVQRILYGSQEEQDQAAQELTAADSRAKHFAGLFAGLGATSDSRVDFWCLDLLWRHFKTELQQNASQAIPLLLAALANDKLQVLDRAFLVLTATGPASVEALLQAIAVSANASHTVAYLYALRYGRSNLYLYDKQVIALLAEKLTDSNEHISWAAMSVLMDISPLRPWFDERMNSTDFEPLYSKALVVARELMKAGNEEFNFAAWYEKLLLQHLAA